MVIREQGRQVQLLRSPYDKEKQRCIQKIFMTFERREIYATGNLADYLAPEQIEQLTPEERQKLVSWLYTKEYQRKSNQAANALASVSETLVQAAQGAKNDYTFLNESSAQKIYSAMDDLQKWLRKKGYTRPAPIKAEQVEPVEQEKEPEPLPVAITKAKTAAKKPVAKKAAKTATKGVTK